MGKPLPLGTVVKPYGEISAVGTAGGERYYWLVDKHGSVAMMPWFVIEPAEAIPAVVEEPGDG